MLEVEVEVDDYGTVLRSYPRRGTEQEKLYVTLSETEVVHLDEEEDVLRLAVPIESRSYEFHGLTAPSEATALTGSLARARPGSATARACARSRTETPPPWRAGRAVNRSSRNSARAENR